MSRKLYAIIPAASLNRALIAQCSQSSVQTVRRSIDGQFALVKWSVDRTLKPRGLPAASTMTVEEARALMDTPEWSRDEEG